MHLSTSDTIRHLEEVLTMLKIHYWLHHDLFSFPWWVLLVTFVVPWVLWWKLVDKSRIVIILVFGLFMSILISLLDEIGTSFGLWSYPTQLIRILPRLYPVDFSFLPVAHMLLFQYFSKWQSYLIAVAITGAVFSFLGEPLFVRLDIYELNHWKYSYSFPIYIAKAIPVKWLVELLLNREVKHTQGKTT